MPLPIPARLELCQVRQALSVACFHITVAVNDFLPPKSLFFINATSTVRGKDGKQLTAVEEQVQRWQEHFGEILSTPAQEHEHEVNTTEHPLVINDPPKHTEIVQAIQQLKKKAAGPDGIPPEVFMASPNIMATLLEPTTWELEHFPDEWKNGYINKLPKRET